MASKAGLCDNKVVELDKEPLKSVIWWRLNLMTLFHGGLDITDPFMKSLFLVGAVEIFPDAAGLCESGVELESGK